MGRFILRFSLFLIVVLLALEVSFRTFLPACEYPRGFQDAEYRVSRFDTTWATEGLRTSGNLCRKLGHWKINNAGWNSIYDYEPRSDRSRPCVAIVGNSFIEGWAVDVEKHMDAEMSRRWGGQVDVYAFGAGGSSMAQYVAMVKYIEENFDPDMYLVFLANRSIQSSLGVTSPYRFYVAESDTGFVLEKPQKRFVQNRVGRYLFRSALGRYIKINRQFRAQAMDLEIQGIERASATSREPYSPGDERLAEFLVDKMLKAARGSNIVFFTDGNRYAIYHDPADARPLIDYRLVENLVQEHESLSLIDLTPAMLEHYRQTNERLEFEHDSHWNEAGHGVAAAALCRQIEPPSPAAPAR